MTSLRIIHRKTVQKYQCLAKSPTANREIGQNVIGRALLEIQRRIQSQKVIRSFQELDRSNVPLSTGSSCTARSASSTGMRDHVPVTTTDCALKPVTTSARAVHAFSMFRLSVGCAVARHKAQEGSPLTN